MTRDHVRPATLGAKDAEGCGATTFHDDDLVPATRPTVYFIGVTTAASSIRPVFPRWAERLGLGDTELVGIDLPLHAEPERYRRVVEFLRTDPLSLGALVTTHKIDLFRAAHDLFDLVDPLARLMGELSCISKRGDALVAHAKDPAASGLALDAFTPPGHWLRSGADAVILGAGGSAIAISWNLALAAHGADRPRRIVVSNRSAPRLEQLARVHEEIGTDIPVEPVHAPRPTVNDALLDALPDGSLVVNATGLGKDAPGSPLTDAARFPAHALVWDLNYRGDLTFLRQARAQAPGAAIVDGWDYFLYGWGCAIAEIYHRPVPTAGPEFEALALLAAGTRTTPRW